MDKEQTVWRIRYINEGEEKMRCMEIHTAENDLNELFDELEQFETARIVSIRNQTLKAERAKNKR